MGDCLCRRACSSSAYELRMVALKACGGALIAAVVGFVLSELGFRGKRGVSSLVIIIFLLFFVDMAEDAVSQILAVPIDEGREAINTALKIVGIGHAFNICADVCTELSETGLATALTVVGRLEILLMVLPKAVDLIEYSASVFS